MGDVPRERLSIGSGLLSMMRNVGNVLQGAPEPLDAPLGLGRVGWNRLDAQLCHDPLDLAHGRVPCQLLLQRWLLGRAQNGVAVVVDAHGQSVAQGDGAQQQEVADLVLGKAKDEEDDLARGIIDGPDQRCLRPPPLEPVEGAAVYLEQHPFRGAAWAPPPVHWGGCLCLVAKPRLREQAVEGGAGDGDTLPLLAQQLLEMAHVQFMVHAVGYRQGKDTLYQGGVGAIGRTAAQVTVDDGLETLLAEAGAKPADLAGSYPQQLRCGAHLQSPRIQSGQDLNPSLLFRVQGNCPHTSSMADIFPEQLNRTFSLSSDMREYGPLPSKVGPPILPMTYDDFDTSVARDDSPPPRRS